EAPAAEAVPSGLSAAPQREDQLPEEQPVPAGEEAAAPTGLGAFAVATDEIPTHREPASAGAAETVPAAPSLQPHVPLVHAEPVVSEPRTLAEWLASGRITGKVGFERDGVTLLLDLDSREYFGPATLK